MLALAASLTFASAAGAQTAYPDLVGTVDAFPATITQGTTAAVTITVRNQGAAATTRAFDVSVALTRDGWLCTQLIFCDESDDDWFVGTTSVPAGFAAGAVLTVTVPIAIPSDFEATTWNLIGLVDGPVTHGWGVYEGNRENNNQSLGGAVQVVAPQTGYPDLRPTAVSYPPALAQGASGVVAITLRNDGFSATNRSSPVSVALSTDGWACTELIFCDESDEDWWVGTVTLPAGFGPGQEITVEVPIAIPADFAATTWNLIGVVDGPVTHGWNVFESDERNNQLLAGPIQVTAP